MSFQSLDFTNRFRKSHGLPPLQWHQAIANIGACIFSPFIKRGVFFRGGATPGKVHSRHMGDGGPFSHAGFRERVQRYPLPSTSAAENLAMSHGIDDPAMAAVR